MSRNPLKSGQCFLRGNIIVAGKILEIGKRRNPLKSGQCFLPFHPNSDSDCPYDSCVAIPSNRVNVSYL